MSLSGSLTALVGENGQIEINFVLSSALTLASRRHIYAAVRCCLLRAQTTLSEQLNICYINLYTLYKYK